MSGKLIIIEAGDGSGKATQTAKLYERLVDEGYKVKKVEYPNYQSQSSALIKMYLNGEFGRDPAAVNPYAASTFYAADRYASYKKEWETFYKEGGIILADRYTTSNMVHQAVKITDDQVREKFLNWLWDFEFNKIGLPIPDAVIFLDMPPEYSLSLMQNRENKAGTNEKDIHERNAGYLKRCYTSYHTVADRYGWYKVSCVAEGKLKSISEIHEAVYAAVKKSL
jgi:dTMP kinase